MKKIILSLLVFTTLLLVKPALAQTEAPKFTGAEAVRAHYKALYFINDADPKKIKGTLRNIANVLEDARLKGKVEIELVAFGDGVAMFEKANPYEDALMALQGKGVILAQCSNTVRERNIDKTTLFSFISYVPSGNGEIVIRGADGWVIVHP